MSRPRSVLMYWVGGPLGAVVLGACLVPLRERTVSANLTFAFMILTIAVAQLGGRTMGIATAIASALSLDFFLTRPYFHLAIADKHDVIAFLGLGTCGIVASALGASRHAEPTRSATAEDAHLAEAHLQYLRTQAWVFLRWGLVASFPIWIQAVWQPLPRFVSWTFVLAQGLFLVVATGYAAVLERWRRGGFSRRHEPPPIARPVGDVAELRAALWFALALISVVPWTYVAFETAPPADLMWGTIACGVTVLLLQAIVAVIGRARETEPLAGEGR